MNNLRIFIYRARLFLFMQSSNVRRRCAAAPAQKGRTHGSAFTADLGKLPGLHGIVGETVFADDGDTGIGLAEQGTFYRSAKL